MLAKGPILYQTGCLAELSAMPVLWYYGTIDLKNNGKERLN
jgi:hypothetical protein